ncbi:SDR family NAD(P)-dependent oxidoreductase [Pseudohalioglobus lutimaris]|uniref:SDR family NAD(P)-dependent oxidoreductase n=1 Tax=Pseudohalioglobus lutimaris TaxID=1737061 RepID=A0A2N5X5F6_9GAMM|nr:SDR family oxidoreductase [Pseudohalioglobus lutimaris]PLW69714.1 SDR family NAD(P)-dependent oxidoreductase [Pseudohalioglobus lutimaris]
MSTATATFNFTGARVLITGGTSGIGLATARGFADAGAHVTITGTREGGDAYDEDLARFEYRQLRVTDNAEIKAVAASLDGLDVLVNNAGNAKFAGPQDSVESVFEEMVRVHLLSGHHLSEACLEMLSASTLPGGASVVGISSLTSFMAAPWVPGYGAGKAGMVQLARTQAKLWGPLGIRSNCVTAGYTDTRLTAPVKNMQEAYDAVVRRTALQRWGQPGEIADAVMFLSSDRASFIDGETLIVDGGYLHSE